MKAIFTLSVSWFTSAVTLGAVVCCVIAPRVSAQPNCAAPPSGLVGWWRAEGNANDSVAGNNGTMQNVGFTAGQVGQAFAFDPQNFNPVRVSIPDQPAFKLTNSLTIEGWIRPRGDGYCIFFRGDNRTGLDPYVLSMLANNVLRFQIEDANNNVAFIDAPLVYDQWWHVAATLDGSSGAMKLYVNGALISQINTAVRPMGDLDPTRDPALGIGNVGEHFNNFPFWGDIDEIALYSRALSPEEIQAIYAAGSAGKCVPTPPPVCVPAPSGLVSWWRGEGDALDSAGSNNGALMNGATFAAGKVGQGFSLNGVNQFVQIPTSSSLNLTNEFTLEFWYQDQGTATWYALIAKRTTASPSNFGIHVNLGGAQGVELFFYDQTLGGFSASDYLPVPASGVFHHLAATFKQVDSSHVELKTFIDGLLVKTTVVSGNLANTLNAAPVTIGAEMGYTMANFFKGVIDEVSLYNRALSASEIQSIYAAGSAGKCAPTPPPTCVTPPLGLVSWWKGESNALDSADSNQGTLVGNATYGAGRVGQGFVFDGNGDGVNVGNPANLQLQNFTIESWIKRAHPSRATQGPQLNGAMFAGPGGGYAFGLWDNGTLLLSKVGISAVSSTLSITDTNNFHHVAVTKSGSNVVFYVDGVAESAAAYDPGFVFNGPMAIGASGGDYRTSFYGAIDEVSVYSRALSASEVQAIYGAGSAGKCVPTPPPTCAPAPSGLVSWWKGESNALDSVDGNHGTLMYGAAFASGKVGQGFSFGGGNSRILLGDPENLKFTNSFSIEAWIYATGLPTGPWGQILMRCDTRTYLDPYYLAMRPDGGIRFHVEDDSGSASHGADVDTSPIPLGQWKHVAGVFDSAAGTLQVFIDGALTAQINTTVRPFRDLDPNASPGVVIGNTMGYVQGFNGMIDELAVYARALAPAEIQSIYGAGSAGKCAPTPPPTCVPAPSGLVSWWRGENSTADAVDGNNGTIAGTGTVTYGPGMVGQAFVFDGTHRDRVNLGNPANLRLEDFTLEAWVKRSSPTVASFDILGADGSVCGDGATIIGYGRGGYYFGITSNGRMILSRVDLDGITSAPLVTDTNWHHLAVTKSGLNAVFYVDGVPQATPAYVHPAPYSFDDGTCTCSAAISIGSRGDARGATFFGMIDEPAVYNRALTAPEVQSIYNAGSAGKCAPTPPPVCVPAPSGLVNWWRGEGDALDSAGSNNGALMNGATFAAGKVGQGFSFNGTGSRVQIPDSASLRLTNELSLELWFNVDSSMPDGSYGGLIGKRAEPGGCNFGINMVAGSSGRLQVYLYDPTYGGPIPASSCPLPSAGVFHHLVATYRQATAEQVELKTYIDGQLVKTGTVSGNLARTFNTVPVTIGCSSQNGGEPFKGMIDEVSIYSRALSASEVQAIYNAGSAGKCQEPPVILTQPVSQKVTVGLNATFSVAASGTPQLRYQWRFNGGDIAGATDSTFSFTVNDTSGGLYSVQVTNAFGAAISSNAVLVVNHPPVADASATLPLVISVNNTNATVVLDGSRSSDADGDPLQYHWFEAGSAEPLATGVVAVVTLPVGSNVLTLTVDDGLATGSQTFAVEVITPAQAAERLVALVNSGAPKPQPLIATLSAALAAIDRSNPTAAINQLMAFQNQVRAQVSPLDPTLAETFIQAAQEIIDALSAGSGKAQGKITLVSRGADGKTRLKGEAAPGALCIIEASTNLVDWEKIGVATADGVGAFEFGDAQSAPMSTRFYRIVLP